MAFQHLYDEIKTCPITGEEISRNLRLPADIVPYGFAYKINSVNPHTIVIIPDILLTNAEASRKLAEGAARFKYILKDCIEDVYWVKLEDLK